MALTLNAEQKSIYHIFSGETQYIIPPYQRAYSWTQTHCKRLFEDIKKAFYSEEQEGYFLGNVVLAKSREKRNKLEVIDGQQRLTTLILLIKVLLSFDKDNKALYNAIWIKNRRTDKEMQRLQTDIFMEQDFNYFREVLAFDFSSDICDFIKDEDNLFKKNICYFYNTLKEFSKYNDIYLFSDFLLDHVYLLPIETEDNNADKARKNALQIFETINNRGLNLSTSDIFKAELYSMALNELKHREFMKDWRELQNRCHKLNYEIDDIFRRYHCALEANNCIVYQSYYSGLTLRNFFLENPSSPFFYKKYDEIINDLFAICEFIAYFKKVVQNSMVYGELSKWFQLVHQAIIFTFMDEFTIYQYFYEYDFQNSENMINICKKMICEHTCIYDDEMQSSNFFLLLGLYLDDRQPALYPYKFFNKGFEHIKYNRGTIIKRKDIKKLNIQLKYTEKELREKAHQFIREYNEN